MLSLRLSSGFSVSEYEKRYGEKISEKFTSKCEEYSRLGLGSFDGDTFRLSLKGFLVSNTVIGELIEAAGTE